MIFFVLRGSLLALNQLFKEMSSVFIRATRVFKFLPLNSTHVSSANRILKSNGETLHISLTDKIKRSGPRMDPWGTPHLILSVSDFSPSKYHQIISCFLLESNHIENQLILYYNHICM